MSTVERTTLPPLVAGHRLRREEFHARYEAMPPRTRAELIGGVVFMPSPAKDQHGTICLNSAMWLGLYKVGTPGVLASENATLFLGDLTEVQPDTWLRIAPDRGGQTRNVGPYVEGAPELIVEVSGSSRAIDLGPKLAEYERAGAREYLVFGIGPDEVFWHVRRENRLVRVVPGPDGLYRSEVFPGLWLDPTALLADDGPALVEALDRGLATAEHAAFVAQLAAR